MDREVKDIDIAILGHFAKDIIEVDGIASEFLGGSVYYGGLAGSHMGLQIAVITRLNQQDFPLLEVFKKNGIICYAQGSNETSGLKNIYSSKNVEFRTYEPLGFAGLFDRDDIPYIKVKYFVIGSITAGEVDIPLLEYLSSLYPDNLCLDIQGFIRKHQDEKVIYKSLSEDEKGQILSKVNCLKLDQSELAILSSLTKMEEAADEISQYGPKEILITHQNGISVYVQNVFLSFPWRNESSFGRTGRGDTAFISYLGSRLTKNPQEALKFSAALTSLKLETTGPFNLPLSFVKSLIRERY